MSIELENLKKEYLEQARLYHWYHGSKFSFFQGKENKVEAERCRYMANYFFAEYQKKFKAELESQ